MADVRPFRGLRYNPEQVGNLSSVITPPYDVINPKQQELYHQRNPYNIIRLEFAKDLPNDDARDNKYTRAAQTLWEWIRQGILIREERPAFYLAEHWFPYQNGYKSYWGLIAAVRLEDFETGQIRPTEVIMKAPAADRLNLLKSCRANLSPIMGIVNQKEGSLLSLFPNIDLNKPSLSATDDFDVTFNLWILDEEETVKKTTAFFARMPIYIADGHHRYTTALAYRDECRASDADQSSNAACNFLMMTLISSNDPGLTMLPTHRVIRGIEPVQLAELRSRLNKHFQIKELNSVSSDLSDNLGHWKAALNAAGERGPAFGIYGLASDRYLLLTPRNTSLLRNMLPPDKPATWKNLDVSLLHGVILQGILGIDEPDIEKETLNYSPNEMEILQEVKTGTAQLGVFLNPVPVSSVMNVADAGDRMPQKSTYFYPKTAAGLVINPLF